MELGKMLKDALQREVYRVYVSSHPPSLRRGFLMGIPFLKEDLGRAELCDQVPHSLDYGDMVLVDDVIYIVVPEYTVEKEEWYWRHGVWRVLFISLLWNGHRYYGRCLRCGASGPIDFRCEVCGA